MPYEPPHHNNPHHNYPRPARRRRRPTVRRRMAARASSRPARPQKARRAPSLVEIYRRRRLMLFTLYALLGVELIAMALTSPVFAVKRVQVSGLTRLSAAEANITAQAGVIPAGTNWLRAPVGIVSSRLARLPWVRSVDVARRLPNKISIQITPREPRVLAQTSEGLFEVDAEGVPIRPATAESAKQLARIVLERPRSVRPGVPLNEPAFAAAFSILQAAQQEPLVRITKIEVDQSDNICLNMQDGIPVEWGQTEEFQTKFSLLKRIYTREPNVARRLLAINLSYPERPACTPRIASTQKQTDSLFPTIP